MTTGVQARGRLGAVVSDRVHDIAKHHAVGFAVFPLGTSTTGNLSSVLLRSQVAVTANLDSGQRGGLVGVL